MKIKIIKDIPGAKAGEIREYKRRINETDALTIMDGDKTPAAYRVVWLIENGWAEEVPDDIDIEHLRSIMEPSGHEHPFGSGGWCTYEERVWFSAYRIVKAVIEKLNDGKIGGIEIKNIGKSFLKHGSNSDSSIKMKVNILPSCTSNEIADKVISLCEPELKVLFGVK